MPDFTHETLLIEQGFTLIAGVDEAGRGPLAGVVVAAAVILPHGFEAGELDDSKKLSALKRETLFEQIISQAFVGIASASPIQIDRMNILQASLWAMGKALNALPIVPHHALIDGKHIPSKTCCPCTALISGDSLSLSIAAASIVAKVMRDHMMVRADKAFPAYGFANHKGYGTKAHLQALQRYGASPLHRQSFAPVRAVL